MDRDAVRARIDAIAPLITPSAWYGKTFCDFWDWYGAQCKVLEAGVRTEADEQWLHDHMLPLQMDTDHGGFIHPEAGYTSVIQPYEHWKSFEERWGMQETVAEILTEFRHESYPDFWKGKTYGEYWTWFRDKEDVLRVLARLPGEREKIEAELSHIRQSNTRWRGITGNEPDANVIA